MTAAEHAEPLPRAALTDVLLGRAPLLGARYDPAAPRGFVSPIEARARLGLLYGDPAAEEAESLRRRRPGHGLGAAARNLLAQALFPAGGARSAPRPFIVSARVDNVTVTEALEAILAANDQGRARMIHFVHPHALNLAARDRELSARLEGACLVLPDGIGLRIAAAIQGVTLSHNVNGTDLLPLICRGAAARGIPIALIGAAPGVAALCAARLTRGTPGLRVPIASHGYLSDEEAAAVVRRVRALGRVVVLVGMGSPLQERWAHQHLGAAPDATVVTVGGLFDFFSGRVPRAPMAVRELGLEWLYRLKQEPRRLARRYLFGNPLFLLRALGQRCFGPGA